MFMGSVCVFNQQQQQHNRLNNISQIIKLVEILDKRQAKLKKRKQKLIIRYKNKMEKRKKCTKR